MGRLVDAILSLSGAAAYGLVGLLAFGEAAAFLGLLLPGEVAVLLGGVVASGGQASLPIMMAVASVAAIAGDSVGYEIGRRFGPKILAWPPFERRFASKAEEAAAYLEAKGGRAVFLGRWTSLLRALVPGLAGMVRMPYRRFLFFNIIGGIAWACTFVLLGYAAGASWRRVERIAGRASLVLLIVILGALIIRWVTRRLASRSDDVRRWLGRVAQAGPVRWTLTTFETPLHWIGARATPGASRGLGWTLSIVVAGSAAWLVGIVIQDLFANEELILLDRPVGNWIATHGTANLSRIAQFVVDAVSPPYGLSLILLFAFAGFKVRDRSAGLRVLIAGLLAGATALALQQILPVSHTGTLFPSVATTWLTASLIALLPAVASRSFALAIRVAGAGLGLLLMTGLAQLIAADTALSGIIGALGLGALIGIGGELTSRAVNSDASVDRGSRPET